MLGVGITLSMPVFGIFSFAAISYGYLVYDTYAYTEDLRTIDSFAYNFCENISHNPKFTKGPVDFRVDRGSVIVKAWENIYPGGALAVTPVNLFTFNKTIILTDKALKGEYLDVIVAHELGHIQNVETSKESAVLTEKEQQADAFAAEIIGTQRVLEFRLPRVNFHENPNSKIPKSKKKQNK